MSNFLTSLVEFYIGHLYKVFEKVEYRPDPMDKSKVIGNVSFFKKCVLCHKVLSEEDEHNRRI